MACQWCVSPLIRPYSYLNEWHQSVHKGTGLARTKLAACACFCAERLRTHGHTCHMVHGTHLQHISLPKIPYIHRIYLVQANPTDTCLVKRSGLQCRFDQVWLDCNAELIRYLVRSRCRFGQTQWIAMQIWSGLVRSQCRFNQRLVRSQCRFGQTQCVAMQGLLPEHNTK